MKQAFYLAFRYLKFSPLRTVILVLCSSLALTLPIATVITVDLLSKHLRSRGVLTPILVGKKGNEFDLTMNALYFRGDPKELINMEVLFDVQEEHSVLSVPLYIKHSASGTPIVGTNIDYFHAREMSIIQGRHVALLGEVAVGATVAEEFKLRVGDTVRSDLQNLYNIAGSYPMTLEVVGVFESTGTADDNAFFADVRTIWALDGLLHGHDKVTKDTSINGETDEENLEATAAIFMFPEMTEENRTEFHLHGDEQELPLSSVAIFPSTQKLHDIILGNFAMSEIYQAVRPSEVVDSILSIVLRIQQGLTVYFGALLTTTIAFFGLVLTLSLQLRSDEITLIKRIGGSHRTVRNMIIAETFLLVLMAVFITVLSTFTFIWLIHTLLGV